MPSSTASSGLPSGVMLNAYPDSIGEKLSDAVGLLIRPELRDVFSLFYILPTFFHSDLDRGFSISDYGMNEELVSPADLELLARLGIVLKFDLVLNHLSVRSMQFLDLLERGEQSPYRDFFIDWNAFWRGHGEEGPDGIVIPSQEMLDKLFMRKPGLPVLKVRFPDGSERPYWNTFYQEVHYRALDSEELEEIRELGMDEREQLRQLIADQIGDIKSASELHLGPFDTYRDRVVSAVEGERRYLGQIDLNADSERVWEFYDATLKQLAGYGAKLIRLDAFAYLHKRPGESNFFNKPGTWGYLQRLRDIAEKYGLTMLPEIHAQYGKNLHQEVADEDYPIYDFFLPGLIIDALERGTCRPLTRWIREMESRGIQTINMLGCHDGIPVLDLAGWEDSPGLLSDAEIDALIERIMARGGQVKNLYGADGKKIAYYQINATYFSALGEDEQKLLLARAIQLFVPGIPQIWYLDLFAGKNDYAAADSAGTAGHKEINRTTLTVEDIDRGLKRPVVENQLRLMRLRNTSSAFDGHLTLMDAAEHELKIVWVNGAEKASLSANLITHDFTVEYCDENGSEDEWSFTR